MDPHEQCQPLSVSSVTPHNTPSVLKWVHVRDAPVPRDTRECKLGHSEMPPHDTPPQTARRKKCKYLCGMGESELSVQPGGHHPSAGKAITTL